MSALIPSSTCRPLAAVATLVALLLGCDDEAAPITSVVTVHVDTDLPVPRLASHLRVDVFDAAGKWRASNDFPLLDATAWPASFEIEGSAQERESVLLRLRAYPEGHARTYQGERYAERTYAAPAIPTSVDEMCALEQELALGAGLWQRRGGQPIVDDINGGTCSGLQTVQGSTAARVEIPVAGRYRFAVVAVTGWNPGAPGDTQITLQLRADCQDESSRIECDSGISGSLSMPEVEADLEPGTYHLVTGGSFNLAPNPLEYLLVGAPVEEFDVRAAAALVTTEASGAEDPRLLVDGEDVTPFEEPLPAVTVDRLVRIDLEPNERWETRVTLRGACAGTQARLSSAPPHQSVDISSATTCVDSEGQLEDLPSAKPISTGERLAPSAAGSWGDLDSCPADEYGDDRVVCVPGGGFILGGLAQLTEPMLSPRTVAVPTFWMDRRELSVGEYRELLAQGFDPPGDLEPFPNEGPLDGESSAYEPNCTFSESALDRDHYPLNCINWELARAVCEFRGGSLPSEAQWEYAASAAGKPADTLYPWGEEPPACACDHTVPCHAPVLERDTTVAPQAACAAQPGGVQPRSETALDYGDATGASFGPLVAYPIFDLAGNLQEYTIDAYYQSGKPTGLALHGGCWEAAPLTGPACSEVEPPFVTAKGGSHYGPRFRARTDFRQPTGGGPFWSPRIYGLRCVFPERP